MGKAIVNKSKPTYVIEYWNSSWGQGWYYHVRSIRGGKIVLDGAEPYSTKSNVKRAIKKLKCIDFSVCKIEELK